MEIIYIVIGWVLGSFSPAISEFLKWHIHDKEKYKESFKAELEELIIRFTFNSLSCKMKIGKLKKLNITKALELCEKYKSPMITPTLIVLLKEMSNQTDEQLLLFNDFSKKPLNLSTTFRKVSSSMNFNSADQLKRLGLPLQKNIHNLRLQIALFNDGIDDYWKFYFLTFDTSITGKNREILNGNLSLCENQIENQSDFIANKIIETLDTLST